MGVGKTQYPLYRKLGVPHGQYRQLRKISPPPGLHPWTVQPTASHNYNYSTPAHRTAKKVINIMIEVYTGLEVMILARHILTL